MKMISTTVLAILALTGGAAAASPPPRLVLQITVDQLRSDQPGRFLGEMGEGGFRYLLDQGVVFRDAHHGHANTETVVGHTTLATGADPAEHGMVSNVWSDRETGKWTYDTFVPIIFAGAGLKPVEVFRRVETVDVAPTLAAWLGTKPPSGAVGLVLPEVLDQRRDPK